MELEQTEQECDFKIAKLEALLSGMAKDVDIAKQENPFFFYVPNDGVLTEERREFLDTWLKPEDIPEVCDSQLDAHKSTADIIAVGGGNQSSKSTFGAIECYIGCTGEVPESMREWYPVEKLPQKFPQAWRVVGVDYKTMLNTLLPTYQKWVPRNYLKNGRWKDSWSAEQNKLFLYKNDRVIATIEFMTNKMDVESFQGPPLDGIIYDEEPRKDIYKENLFRFTTALKLRIVFAMTPTKGLTWVKDDIFDQVETDGGNSVETFKLASVCNKMANLKILTEILKGLDSYEERQMRLLGEFISLSGLVYGNIFNRSIHVIDPFEIAVEDPNGGLMPSENFIVYRGIDPHLVKPTVAVEVAVDRNGIEYVIGTYSGKGDTSDIKYDLARRARTRGYRLGWSVCDKSADSTISVLGDRNIYLELKQGKDAIPGLFTSDRFPGSISAGVDRIKKKLKNNEMTGMPSLYIFNTPENKILIKAMQTLERDSADNEEKVGIRDKIAEGKHDAHACLRYCHQRPMRWIPMVQAVPEYVPDDEEVGY